MGRSINHVLPALPEVEVLAVCCITSDIHGEIRNMEEVVDAALNCCVLISFFPPNIFTSRVITCMNNIQLFTAHHPRSSFKVRACIFRPRIRLLPNSGRVMHIFPRKAYCLCYILRKITKERIIKDLKLV